jgi:signal recognition particle subunit SRP54
VRPDEIILVADGALGQEAVNVAKAFHEALTLTGLILTKLDGDARGGAALSIKSITGVPIKFVGTGEKTSEFDVFHPDRLASRILGMGDVVSLVEKAAEVIDQKEAEKMAEKMRKADFTLEDFLAQMQQIKKLGSLGGIMGMMPGMSGMKIDEDAAESGMKRTEAIILSMTYQERRKPDILNGSRRLRIANGAGVKVVEVNQLLKQFQQMQQMMKMLKGGGSKKMMRQLKEMERKGGPGGMGGGGFGGFGGGMPRF